MVASYCFVYPRVTLIFKEKIKAILNNFIQNRVSLIKPNGTHIKETTKYMRKYKMVT